MGLNENEIGIIRQDFRSLIADASKVYQEAQDQGYERRGYIRRGEDGVTRFWHRRTGTLAIHTPDLFWYGGEKSPLLTLELIGRPKDYLTIRDDPQALKKFLADTLDQGRQEVGYSGGHGGSYPETVNFSDYLIWLYRNSKYRPFRASFRETATTLLEEELETGVRPFPIEMGREAARKNQEFHEQLVAAKTPEERAAIDAYYDFQKTKPIKEAEMQYEMVRIDPSDPREVAFKARFEEEFARLKVVGEWRGREGLEIANFNQASPEFRELAAARQLEREAQRTAMCEYRPLLNRLMGLLDIFEQLAKPNNGFARGLSLIQTKAREGFYKDVLPWQYRGRRYDIYEGTDIYARLLRMTKKQFTP